MAEPALVPSFSRMDAETRELHLMVRHPGVKAGAHRQAHTGPVDHEHIKTIQDVRDEAGGTERPALSREQYAELGYYPPLPPQREPGTGAELTADQKRDIVYKRQLFNWRGWRLHK